jgi:hypothetical protein
VQLYLSTGASTGSVNFRFLSDQVIGPTGTASLPSYTFINDTDTGMYWAGANAVGISTNGTRIIRISPTGVFLNPDLSIETYGVERSTTTNGSNLIVNSGGAVSGGTNLSGGDLILYPGITTGNGRSYLRMRSMIINASGTTDSTLSERDITFPIIPTAGSSSVTFTVATLTFGSPGSASFMLNSTAVSHDGTNSNALACSFSILDIRNLAGTYLSANGQINLTRIQSSTNQPSVSVNITGVSSTRTVSITFSGLGTTLGFCTVSVSNITLANCTITVP